MSKKKRSSTSQLQFIRPDRLLWECVSNSRVTLKINPEFFSPESGTAGLIEQDSLAETMQIRDGTGV